VLCSAPDAGSRRYPEEKPSRATVAAALFKGDDEKERIEMSATGLDVFDKTLQTTNTWLKEIMEDLGPDRQVAWHTLRAVLHALRDRLPIDEVAHFGAQLPLLVRGAYYDQWHPAGKPEKIRHQDEFIARVHEELSDIRPVNPTNATRTVFKVVARHIDRGECEKIERALPREIRELWPDA
jgi:uncharacterized protein (DUF2267 family)